MKAYLYFYRAYSGKSMPAYHCGSYSDLRDVYRNSTTPMISCVPLDSVEVTDSLVVTCRAWLIATPVSEMGLVSALQCVIRDMLEWVKVLLKDKLKKS